MRWSSKSGGGSKLVRPDGRTSPITGNVKQYSVEFKATVALEDLRRMQTVAQLTLKHGVLWTTINAWKKRAVEGMTAVFSSMPPTKTRSTSSMPRSASWRGTGFLASDLGSLSVGKRRETIEPDQPQSPITRPCRRQQVGFLRWPADREPRRDPCREVCDPRPIPQNAVARLAENGPPSAPTYGPAWVWPAPLGGRRRRRGTSSAASSPISCAV